MSSNNTMTDDDRKQGLINAFILDGKGGGREIGWSEIDAWHAGEGILWVHLDRGSPGIQHWLLQRSGIDPLVCNALLAPETHPRYLLTEEGMLIILRGVNLNAGAEQEDMVSVRVWIDHRRIVSLRLRRVMAVNDIRESLLKGQGPSDQGDFIAELAGRLVERISPVIGELDDRLDEIEDLLLSGMEDKQQEGLAETRREVIRLRRHLAPQRLVLAQLHVEHTDLLSKKHRARLREVSDHTNRYVEYLDEAREHALVIQDQVMTELSQQMNQTMYLLSVIAAIMLPLGLLTGLLGINVGGIPGTENPLAFTAVAVSLLILAALEFFVLRKLKWI
jgi:zinc transporter